MSDTIVLPDRRYSVIYADPPWSYRQCGTTDKSRGTAAKHYSTMTTEDICAMPIQSICEPAAACFMWARFPNIVEAVKVMESWGFVYKTAAFSSGSRNMQRAAKTFGAWAHIPAQTQRCVCLELLQGSKPER